MKKTALLIACAGLMLGAIELSAPQSASAGLNISFGSGIYTGGYGYNSGVPGYGYGLNRGFGNFNYNRGYGYGGYGNGYGNNCYRGSVGRGLYNYPAPIVPYGNYRNVVPGRYYGHHHHH